MNARRGNPFRPRRWTPGSAPGTISVDPEAHPSRIVLMDYDTAEFHEAQVTDLAVIEQTRSAGRICWVNVDGLGDATVLTGLQELFDLHPLAMEDVVNVGQRPKVEDYDDQFFIVVRMPTAARGRDTEQISIFLGEGFVITFQERSGDCLEPVRKRIREGRSRLRGSGSGYLAYAILDAVVDAYFPVLEGYGDRLLDLEHRLLEDAVPVRVSDLYDLKRDLMVMRSCIRPLREELASLVRSDSVVITAEVRTFLRDCYDHAIQLIDLVESYRELGASLIELYRSNAANRLNEVMKVLTIIATVFIPMSFVAGVYGMNFDPSRSRWNMPELGWSFGYPFAIGIMALVAVGMLIYFKRKDWI